MLLFPQKTGAQFSIIPCMPPMTLVIIVGQASFQIAPARGPSMMDRSNVRPARAGAAGAVRSPALSRLRCLHGRDAKRCVERAMTDEACEQKDDSKGAEDDRHGAADLPGVVERGDHQGNDGAKDPVKRSHIGLHEAVAPCGGNWIRPVYHAPMRAQGLGHGSNSAGRARSQGRPSGKGAVDLVALDDDPHALAIRRAKGVRRQAVHLGCTATLRRPAVTARAAWSGVEVDG